MISLPACTVSAGWHLGGGFGSHKAAPFFFTQIKVSIDPFMRCNMSELFNTVVPKQHPLTESEFHSLLVADKARPVVAKYSAIIHEADTRRAA